MNVFIYSREEIESIFYFCIINHRKIDAILMM